MLHLQDNRRGAEMNATSFSAQTALHHRPATCRQRHLTQRPTICRRQRVTCAAKRDQNDRTLASCGAVAPTTVSAAMLWASSAVAADVQEAAEGAAAAVTNTSAPSTFLGLNLFEVILLAAPLVLYGIFNLYRSQVNQQAKLVDFVSVLAAIVIFGNIFSVLVFKVRLY